MSTEAALRDIVVALDAAGIPHMIAGSFASSHHGKTRATSDIDFIIDPPDEGSLARFIDGLDASRYYVARGMAAEALRRRDQFNVLDHVTRWKLDLIVRKDRSFSVSEFGRRQPGSIAGVDVFVATAEDTVLSKLDWSRTSDSARQHEDVVELLEVRTDLDDAYLDRWAAELGVSDQLAACRAEALASGNEA